MAIAGLLAFAGLSFLILSVVPIYGSQPEPGASAHGFASFIADDPAAVNQVRPQNAASVSGVAAQSSPPSTGPATATATPSPPVVHEPVPQVVREAVPLDALPVNRAQPLSGTGTRPATPSQVKVARPITVAVVSHLADSPLVAQTMAALSRDEGLQVYEADIASLQRPDVLLLLDRSTTGSSVWFCGPAPNESSILASAVLPYTKALGQEPEEAIGDAVDQSLSCPNLHAGRARMAAVDLRLPIDGSPVEQIAGLIAEGVQSYLSGAKSRIRSDSSHKIVWPAYGPITSPYGPSHPLGIDIGQSTGDIVAATDGVISFAGGDPCCSYGLYVIIESPDGITTLYGHLSGIYVKEGQEVRAGQPIGPVGNTGHSTGTHLHFETLVDGVRVNPLSVLP